MNAAQVVKEVVQFFWSIRPDHKHVISTMEPAKRLAGFPA